MRIRTALSTLALTAASLAVGAGGALADEAPDVTVNNSSSATYPGVCASNQFSFVTVPVNLAGGSDSGAC